MFYSDLDSTLIFSKRYLPEEQPYTCIDKKEINGKILEISYILDKSLVILNKLIECNLFIPVTTRNLTQYNRIQFINQNNIEWAIISAGEMILHNGVEFKPYTQLVERKIGNNIEKAEQFLNNEYICKKMSKYTFLLNANDNKDFDLDKLNKSLEEFDFITIPTKEKPEISEMLVQPKEIDKAFAVNYLKKLLKDNNDIVSGDAPPDLHMLKEAKIAIINKGMKNILHILEGRNNVKICNSSSFEGGYQILLLAQELLKESKYD